MFFKISNDYGFNNKDVYCSNENEHLSNKQVTLNNNEKSEKICCLEEDDYLRNKQVQKKQQVFMYK